VNILSVENLVKDYGYGFIITQDGNLHYVGHRGTKEGAGSRFEYYPAQDIYVIVLSNYGAISANIVADHIKDLIEPNN
jgi:CubicO group peptidase (beta-lactamase class C family)